MQKIEKVNKKTSVRLLDPLDFTTYALLDTNLISK